MPINKEFLSIFIFVGADVGASCLFDVPFCDMLSHIVYERKNYHGTDVEEAKKRGTPDGMVWGVYRGWTS